MLQTRAIFSEMHIVYPGGGLDIPKHYVHFTYKYMSCTHAYMVKMHDCVPEPVLGG